MDQRELMQQNIAYSSHFECTPVEEQQRAKQLCWGYNQTAPDELEKRKEILQ
jgi:hypothetical protein